MLEITCPLCGSMLPLTEDDEYLVGEGWTIVPWNSNGEINRTPYTHPSYPDSQFTLSEALDRQEQLNHNGGL